MDPVTAFSLACGVIQVVDFSLRLLSKSKEIQEKGSLAENDSLEYLTSHTKALNLELRTTVNDNKYGGTSSQGDQDLGKLADRCSETAQTLMTELAKLKVSDLTKKSQVMKVSLRSMLKRSTLKELERRMSSYRDVLNTRILVDLRNRLNATALEQTDSFRKTDERLQGLLLSFAKLPYSFEQLTKLIEGENTSTKAFIGHELKQLEVNAAERRNEEEFLASLHFPEINYRQEEIKDSHKRTFQWIFDQSGKKIGPWSNFIDWLQTGSGVYWISGKPGSGKSTLMNYICQDERTMDALDKWAAGCQSLTPTFFFWLAGSQLQRSMAGLLRSLIYQILCDNPSFITKAARHSVAPGTGGSNSLGLGLKTVWSEKKLLTYFSKLIETVAESHRICLFIDGLDEFDGDHYDLIGMILKIVEQSSVKCCVSSRPEKPFQRFESSSMLRLQDLTRSDIETYVESKLGELPQIKGLPVGDQDLKRFLMEQVVNKADGVFLWVELAVKHQIIGIHFNDSFETLQQRLHSLPLRVEDLYADMLRRIDPAHHQEAARYLYLTLNIDDYVSSVFNFTLAIYGLQDGLRLNPLQLDTKSIASKCQQLDDRINAICAGFLETYNDEDYDMYRFGRRGASYSCSQEMWLCWEKDLSLKAHFEIDWSSRKVKFCHRTSFDFFNDSEGMGGRFLHNVSSLSSQRGLTGAAICLARMSLCNLVDADDLMSLLVYNLMQYLSETEGIDKYPACPRQYLEYVDKSISAFDRALHRPLDGSHWCTRWGKYYPGANWPNPKMFEYKTAPDVDTPGNSPSDFLSFATSSGLSRYVNEVLDQPGLHMDSNRATCLAICAIAYKRNKGVFGQRHEWKILDWTQFELVARLVRMGADLRRGLNGSIWRALLRFLYSVRLDHFGECSRNIHEVMSNLPQMLEGYPSAELNPHPIIPLIYYHTQLANGSTFFECDTSLAPLFRPQSEDSDSQLDLRRPKAASQGSPSINPLRIWVSPTDADNDDYWPPEEHLMTHEQIRSLHVELAKVVSCNEEDLDERRGGLSRALNDIAKAFRAQ